MWSYKPRRVPMATEVIQCLNSSVRAAAQQSALNVPYSFTLAVSWLCPRRASRVAAQVWRQLPINVATVFDVWESCDQNVMSGHVSWFLSVAVCFYFLESSRGRLADGFIEGPNLNQMSMKFQSCQLIFNPIFTVGLYSPWNVLSFPSNNVCVCVCMCGTWSFFFGHKLRGVKFMWNYSPFGILADHSWLKHDDVQKGFDWPL